MEKHLRKQINPLLITIIGLEKVKVRYPIRDFKPISNIWQAQFIAKEVGVKTDNLTAEEVCQAIIDYNNETGYIFRDRTPAQIVTERKAIAIELGKNPNLVPENIVINRQGEVR